MHYLKSSCIYDLLAIIPFDTFFKNSGSKFVEGKFIRNEELLRKFRLIKLLRVPRLFELLNVDRFKKFIKEYYN